MTEKIALARRMRALAGRETTDVNTTRGIAIVTRMRLARANEHVHQQQPRVRVSCKGYLHYDSNNGIAQRATSDGL